MGKIMFHQWTGGFEMDIWEKEGRKDREKSCNLHLLFKIDRRLSSGKIETKPVEHWNGDIESQSLQFFTSLDSKKEKGFDNQFLIKICGTWDLEE
jgi:hypothetical protein